MRRKTTAIVAALAALAVTTGAAQAQFNLKFEDKQSKPQRGVRAGIAHIRVGALTETPQMQGLFGPQPGAAQTTYELVSRLEAARKDQDIRAVVVDLNMSSFGLGPSHRQDSRLNPRPVEVVDKEIRWFPGHSCASFALVSSKPHAPPGRFCSASWPSLKTTTNERPLHLFSVPDPEDRHRG